MGKGDEDVLRDAALRADVLVRESRVPLRTRAPAAALLTVLLATQALECGTTPAQVPLAATAYRLLLQARLEAYLSMWAAGPVGAAWRTYVRATDQADLSATRASADSSDGTPTLYPALGLLRDQARLAAGEVISAGRLRGTGLPAIGDLVIVLPDYDRLGPVTTARIVAAGWRWPVADADVVPDEVDTYVVQATKPRPDNHDGAATSVSVYDLLLDAGPDDARHPTVGATQARIVAGADLRVAGHAFEKSWPTGALLTGRLPQFARWPDIHTAVTDVLATATAIGGAAGGAICRAAADWLTSPQ